jgi:hypothetical protein
VSERVRVSEVRPIFSNDYFFCCSKLSIRYTSTSGGSWASRASWAGGGGGASGEAREGWRINYRAENAGASPEYRELGLTWCGYEA